MTLVHFLATGKDVRVSIQSKFTQYLADARLQNFKSLLVGPLVHYGAWHTYV